MEDSDTSFLPNLETISSDNISLRWNSSSVRNNDEFRLLRAVHSGDLFELLQILDDSPNINLDALDNQHQSALFLAARFGRNRILDILLERGANPTLRDLYEQTPLHIAASKNDVQIVKRLLETVEKVDVLDLYERTPLFCAAESGNEDVLRLLLSFGANPNMVNKEGISPLWIATKNENEACIEALLLESRFRTGRDIDVDLVDPFRRQTALHVAAKKGSAKIVEWLINSGSDAERMDVFQKTPLLIAVEKGHSSTVSFLLKRGVSVTASGHRRFSVLHISAKAGYLDITKTLLLWEVDIEAKNDEGDTPLMLACRHGHYAIVSELLKASAKIEASNLYGETPLLQAAIEGHQDIMSLLISNKADLNASRNDGQTALHLAVANGHFGAARLLLSTSRKHIKMERHSFMEKSLIIPLHLRVDVEGETALHVAARFHRVEIIRLLLRYDASYRKKLNSILVEDLIHYRNRNGWTALHEAAFQAHLESVQVLLSHGADVFASDVFGNSAIHYASRNLNSQILIDLLRKSKNVAGTTNVEGRTPLHFAAACARPVSAKTLLEAGANPIPDHLNQHPIDLVGDFNACNPPSLSKMSRGSTIWTPPSSFVGDSRDRQKTHRLLSSYSKSVNFTNSYSDGFNSQPCLHAKLMDEMENVSIVSSHSNSFPIFGVAVPLGLLSLLILLTFLYVYRRFKRIQNGSPRHERHNRSPKKLKTQGDSLDTIQRTQNIDHRSNLGRRDTFQILESILEEGRDGAPSLGTSSDSDGSSCRWSMDSTPSSEGCQATFKQ